MSRFDDEQSENDIFASDGATIHRLALRWSKERGTPMLVDTAGTVVAPWEIELLRWPPAVEPELRRGGYLVDRGWPATEPWCNCAD